MKIFGTSIHEAADAFLHAGYISAYPGPPDVAGSYPMFQDTADTGYAASLDAALRLADGELAEHAATAGGGLLASLGPMGPGLLGIAACAALVALAWRLSGAWGGLAPRALRWSTAAPALAALGLASACLVPPWQDLEPRDFDDPQAATTVLIHAVVRDGLLAHQEDAGRALNLAAIQDHVRLPGDALTEGQEYALQAYGWDGWAHDLDFATPDSAHYEIASAGADGELDSADDHRLDFLTGQTLGADHGVYYLARVDGELWVMVRDHEDMGEPMIQPTALFGGDYLGVPVTAETLQEQCCWEAEDPQAEAQAIVADVTAFYEGFATADDPDPVVVQIYGLG